MPADEVKGPPRKGSKVIKFVKGYARNRAKELATTISAAWRVGIKDLQTVVLNPFPEQHVATHEEPGMPFMPPMYETPLYNREQMDPPAHAPVGRKAKEIDRD